jgi:hypothetical protein
MSFTLYDAVVPSWQQILGSVMNLLEKAQAHCAENNLPDSTLIEARLADDMLPLGFHVRSVVQALAEVAQIDPAEVNGFIGRDMRFEAGERRMDFVAENFLLSFSQPNFYFHATTTYDILRHLGLPIGKRDFMGIPRVKS